MLFSNLKVIGIVSHFNPYFLLDQCSFPEKKEVEFSDSSQVNILPKSITP